MNRNNSLVFYEVEGDNWHLRRESDGGVLIINGSKVIELNKAGYRYVALFLKSGANDSKTVWSMLRYGVNPIKAKKDWLKLKRSLVTAAKGCCAGSGINIQVGERCFQAPLRVDLALTYICNNDCFHCYAGGSHKTEELTTLEWQNALDKLWQFGVPQVAFTGGESLLRADLLELIQYAKGLGMITGLITNGRLLTSEKVTKLVESGLDYVQITIESHLKEVHDRIVGIEGAFEQTLAGLKNALASSLRVTTNTTMTSLNEKEITDTLDFLLQLGVSRIGLNGLIRSQRGKNKEGLPASRLKLILNHAKKSCAISRAELIWFTPTCYLAFDPLQEGFGTKRCAAAQTVLAIEPDGRIIPCQSYFDGLGNIKTDSLKDAWNHPLAMYLRERKWLDKTCQGCTHLMACGGSCPLEYEERAVL